jgi:hypothetical protein
MLDKKNGTAFSVSAPQAINRLCRELSTGEQGLNHAYFATGIVNSAPLSIVSGQRCITDL